MNRYVKYIKEILKPYYHRFQRICKATRRSGLHCKDFSIISNNCTAGYVYQYYGISYKTPTEGLYFTAEDYIKIVKRPEYYFKQEVKFIDPKTSTLYTEDKPIHHPVGRIDDVEIYFLHYSTEKEALSKWIRRSSRINYDKLFFLLTENEFVDSFVIEQFDSLKTNNKICLTTNKYDKISTQYVTDVPRDGSNTAWKPEIILSVIDWKKVLNNL